MGPVIGASMDEDNVRTAAATAFDKSRSVVFSVPCAGCGPVSRGIVLGGSCGHSRSRERYVHIELGTPHMIVNKSVPIGFIDKRQSAVGCGIMG